MKNYSDIQSLMRDEIKKTDEVLIERLNSNVDLINQMSHYIIASGGKRLRPLLLLLSARATNYKGKDHYKMEMVEHLMENDEKNASIYKKNLDKALKNIDKLISKETGLPVHIADDPLACVAIGTGKALDQEETFSSMLTEY